MPPPEWHARFALQMLEIAGAQKNAWVACHAILRAFEEVIDAYCAQDGLHFHDDYPVEAWKKRTEWLHSSRPDLLEDWNRLLGLCAQVAAGQPDAVLQMLVIARNRSSDLHSA